MKAEFSMAVIERWKEFTMANMLRGSVGITECLHQFSESARLH
jgi:hypothetical protein